MKKNNSDWTVTCTDPLKINFEHFDTTFLVEATFKMVYGDEIYDWIRKKNK